MSLCDQHAKWRRTMDNINYCAQLKRDGYDVEEAREKKRHDDEDQEENARVERERLSGGQDLPRLSEGD